ncbi:MAG: flagellar hook-associated protein FlgK [Acidobacteria bacterium]|nr:MAG: flagellar hook-associated protein FlgK [Acidobacteriota bacterium]
MSAFSHLWLGVTALRAFRRGMDTAGYNVANANTPGFSRRRVELAPLEPSAAAYNVPGLGVGVAAVRRDRDPFLDFATRREMSRLGGDAARTEVLTALEPALTAVDGSALTGPLGDLFDAFEALAVQPDDPALRRDAIAAAENLAAAIRRFDARLAEARRAADSRVADAVDRINEITRRLAQINAQQPVIEAGGPEASDLRDERDRLLDELSHLAGVQVVYDERGRANVFLQATGDALVTGTTDMPLRLSPDGEGMQRVYVSRGGERVDLTGVLRLGKLGGLLAARDETLVAYRDRLDAFATAVIEEFNAAHRAGFDLDGQPGLALFLPDPPGARPAAAIEVNTSVADDPRRVAAASAAGEPGNNENALALAGLRESTPAGLGGQTLLEAASALVGEIGRDAATADLSRQASASIVSSFESRRQEVSGVSLDEEAANLARWEQSFQAAARFMKVVNDVTEVALQILR